MRKQFVRSWRCHLIVFFGDSSCRRGWIREAVGQWERALASTITGGDGVIWGQTDLQLVLQLLERVTLCLTPLLKAELHQARPLLAEKQHILSLLVHLSAPGQQGGWRTNERLGKTEWQGEEEWQSQTGERGRYWGRNVSSLSTLAKRPEEGLHYWHFSSQDCLANAHSFLGDLQFHIEKRSLSSHWRCECCDFSLSISQAMYRME